MTIQTAKVNDTLTIAPAGKLDTVTAPQLEKCINENLSGVAELIFDFSALEYISSAGLRVLLMAQKIMLRQGKLKVTHVNETVGEIFELTGFSDILMVE